MNASLNDDGLYDSSSADDRNTTCEHASDRGNTPRERRETRLTRRRKQHLDPLAPFLAQEISKLDARQQAADVLFKLGADKVVAADKALAERSRRVGGVPGLVDEGDDLVHPFAVRGREGDEGREFRV